MTRLAWAQLRADNTMTSSIAIALLIMILGMVAADQLWFGGDFPLLVARSLDGFIEHLSFWR